MNRADLLHEVLKDGQPHSRREIFERVGYMLTNNAASELRARGVDVVHKREGRIDTYQLGLTEGGSPTGETPPGLVASNRRDLPGLDELAGRPGALPSAPSVSPSGTLREPAGAGNTVPIPEGALTAPEAPSSGPAGSRSVSAPPSADRSRPALHQLSIGEAA